MTVPIVCLVVFWGFANYLTLGDGLRLYNQGTLINKLTVPVDNIVRAVQAERRASVVYLAAPSAQNQESLAAARKVVDRDIAEYRKDLSDSSVRSVATDRMMGLARDELTRLDGLRKLRDDVDGRSISTPTLMSSMTDMLDGVNLLYSQVTNFPDEETAAEGRSLAMLSHARELRSREDAVLAGALATGKFSGESYRMFVQAVGVQQYQYHEAYAALTPEDQKLYDAFVAKAPFPELAAMERSAIDKGRPGHAVPVNETQWAQANATALSSQYTFEQHLNAVLSDHAKAPSYLIFLRLGLAGLLGLIVIVISVLVARRVSRSLIKQLRALRDSARDLAWVRLPAVVQRLSSGQSVDVDREVPSLPAGKDEIGQVSEAFNEVGRTAVRAANEQAELRSGVANVFLNIARRSQTLLQRQIGHLDVMERKAAEPEALEDLFRIDHLATRMRRNAENLVILGGGQPGRVWHEPMPLLDVLRSAASEVEQYERVRVLPFPPMMLAGSVISDVVHLTAELIDNATAFSPPHTKVNVTGQAVPKGFAVEIEDRGLGMKPEDVAAANRWLATPPEFDVLALSENARLGMFVVARIAARHGIRVHLRPSPYGGTTAIILLPSELVAEAGAVDELSARDADRTAVGEADDEALVPADVSPVRGPVLVSAGVRDGDESEAAVAEPTRLPVRSGGMHRAPSELEESAGPDESPAPADPAIAARTDEQSTRPEGPTPRYEEPPVRHEDPVTRYEESTVRHEEPATSGWPTLTYPSGDGEPAGLTPRAVPPAMSAIDSPTVETRIIDARRVVAPPAEPPRAEPPRPEPPRADPPRVEPPRPSPRPDSAPPSPRPRTEPVAAESTAEAPAASPESDPVEGGTHLGLPKRVRQANLAPGLRNGPPRPGPNGPQTPSAPQRSPEEIRKMMSSYQRGTTRGRLPDAPPDGEKGDEAPTLGTPPQAQNLTTVESGREDG
ncbi:sensor histidine kinase [Actinocatenispora rupis]|uniref:sensor histidine kinase n=1 Tax=Actinocatenispora rupis TaxID=519421 RepID=UPI00194462A0|nr:nitrate- and nitrite sensing domain-containing protein [Actinocatenispora rupis]